MSLPDHKCLRISVTDSCDLNCGYCKSESISARSANALMTFEEIVKAVKCLSDPGDLHIRLTGGEPLLRNNIHELVSLLVPISSSVSLTTNGMRLSESAALLKLASIDGINIHIDTVDPVKFKELTGSNIEVVLKGINAAKEAGIPMKLNTVLLRGINDNEIDTIISFGARLSSPVRFIELMPFCDERFYNEHFIPADVVLDGREFETVKREFGNGPAVYYREVNTGAVVGVISSVSRKFCGECDRLRLTSDGKLKRCLADESSLDLRACEFSKDAVHEYLSGKAFDHKNYARVDERTLRAIGG